MASSFLGRLRLIGQNLNRKQHFPVRSAFLAEGSTGHKIMEEQTGMTHRWNAGQVQYEKASFICNINPLTMHFSFENSDFILGIK